MAKKKEKLPKAREDGICCRCNEQKAVTCDGRYCSKCNYELHGGGGHPHYTEVGIFSDERGRFDLRSTAERKHLLDEIPAHEQAENGGDIYDGIEDAKNYGADGPHWLRRVSLTRRLRPWRGR